MRRLLLVLTCGVFLVSPFLEAKSAFSGTYSISGSNPGVGPYRGTLTIVPRGDVYDVHWSIANVQYSGIGVVAGDTLSVAYSAGDRSWMGVIAYRQLPNGSLEGRWALYGGKSKTGSETAVRK